MQLSADLSLLVQAASHEVEQTEQQNNTTLAKRALGLLDYTSLNETDSVQSIEKFCLEAQTEFGPVAAVCVYPQFVLQARAMLDDSPIKVATVINFPHGSLNAAQIALQTRDAIHEGAHEIDLVLPYQAFLAEDTEGVRAILKSCKDQCVSKAKMKVILETGALPSAAAIKDASFIAMEEGADFIKTSTGKIPAGASLEAAAIMLTAIKEFGNPHIGFKPSGGIRTFEDARTYLSLSDRIMGEDWADAAHFRFGASSLLSHLLSVLGQKPLSESSETGSY